MIARFQLAGLLLVSSEIALWTLPRITGLFDAALMIIGYVVLAALLLELGLRFRVRGWYGLLALAGLYALLHAVLINPQSALADLPRTVFTRVLGANALIGGAALGLFLMITRSGQRRRPGWIGIGAFVVLLTGIAWGIWARWSPMLTASGGAALIETPIPSLYAAALPAALALWGLLRLRSTGITPLGRLGWTLTAGTTLGLLVAWLLNSEISGLGIGLTVPLLAICLGVLYWQRRSKGGTVWDQVGTAKAAWPLLIAMGGWLAAGLIGMMLPRADGAGDPVFLLSALFTAYGFVWLPTIALVIALRGLGRMLRAGDL